MIAVFTQHAPELFDVDLGNGTRFRCSDAWVRKYIHEQLGWSLRACTCAAQKLPDNYEEILLEAYLREAWIIRNHHISAELREADRYEEAQKLGFLLEPSCTDTYWSTIETMKSLVNNVIAPYFDSKKAELGIRTPKDQSSIWKIDCWSIHKSKEFLAWMKATHPNIIVIFVPGNCTCVFQPLDVGIQRVLKLSIKHSAQRDAVTEVIHQMDEANKLDEAGPIKLDTSVVTLRNRSLCWIVQAFHDINKPELVKKVHAPYPLIDEFDQYIYRPLSCVKLESWG